MLSVPSFIWSDQSIYDPVKSPIRFLYIACLTVIWSQLTGQPSPNVPISPLLVDYPHHLQPQFMLKTPS